MKDTGRSEGNVIFLNTERDADMCLGSGRHRAPRAVIVTTRPVVHAYAGNIGLDAEDTLKYFTSSSHGAMLDRSEVIMDWVWSNTEFSDMGFGVKEAYKESFTFFTRLAVHYFIWALEIGLNAVREHDPAVLVASQANRARVSSPYIENEENYFGDIIRLVSEKSGLRFEDLAAGSPVQKPVADRALLKILARHIGFMIWAQAVSLKCGRKKERPVFFATKYYNMDKVLREAMKISPDREHVIIEKQAIPSTRVPKVLKWLLWNRVFSAVLEERRALSAFAAKVRGERELFSYRGISFAGLLARKLEDNINDQAIGLCLWTDTLDRFIASARPGAVISNGNRLDDVLLAEISNRHRIPTILVSHGSHVEPSDRHSMLEWADHCRHLVCGPFSKIALQTPPTEKMLEVLPTKARTMKTGPIIWGKPVERDADRKFLNGLFKGRHIPENIKVITHAGTPKINKGFRAYVYETPDEYIQAVKDLAVAVNNMEGAVLVVRFRPSSEITVEALRRKVPFSDKVVLSDKGPFSDALAVTDLLVSFSSTTIEEALQNRVPVLLYGGEGRYKHLPAFNVVKDKGIKPSAVYHVSGADQLEDSLKRIMAAKAPVELFDEYIYKESERVSMKEFIGI